jgi:RNA polymerase sigma-70 factor (ECF subfamily)
LVKKRNSWQLPGKSVSSVHRAFPLQVKEKRLPNDNPDTVALLERVRGGDAQALEELLARHRPLLRRFVEMRFDPKLHARLDASDVVQEAQLEIARRIQEFLQKQPMPFGLWLQKTAYENLIRLRRTHVVAGRRSVDREVRLPENSSIMLVRQLLGQENWPGRGLVEDEIKQRVLKALSKLDDIDREILQLRAFEQLDNQEVAQFLGLDPGTASKRYGRALLRLRAGLLADGLPETDT